MNDIQILNTAIFVSEIIIIYKLQKKVGWFHPILYGAAIPFFYSMAPFIDYIITGRKIFNVYSMDSYVDAGSTHYLLVNLLYFSYILSFYLVTNYTFRSNRHFTEHNGTYIRESGFVSTVVLLLSGSVLYYYTVKGFYLERNEMKSAATILSTMLMQTSFLYINFYLVTISRKNLISAFLMISIIIYASLSFERENIVIASYALAIMIWKEGKEIPKLAIAVLASLLMVIINNYKAVMVSFKRYVLGEDVPEILLAHDSFSLTMLDPVVTIILITEYFNENPYTVYFGSYITNSFMQFLRMFGLTEWKSLGEFATYHYTGDTMGTGFSMIVESMISFGYAGPLIIGGITAYIFCRITNKVNAFKNIIYVVLFIYSLKIVRTEFAVVIKLYIIPAIIAYLMLQFFYKRKYQ